MNQRAVQAMCTSVAGRYAVALYNVAAREHTLERTMEECDTAMGLLSVHNVHKTLFIRMLQGRTSGVEELQKCADFQEFFMKFLKLIAQNKRIHIFKDVVRLFYMLANQALGRITLTVYTAQEISDEHKKSIEAQLSNIFKQTLRITYKMKPHILGGILVQSDSLTIDASVKHQIEKFQKEALSYTM
ncbi:MAG: ATP synthase F1 subunit delta [Holosporales bacterium]|jgi:F-type H+-transporting ATPase subunit delta|nr:ATP synthase F1 subunit delta [Holosporales bacterium]